MIHEQFNLQVSSTVTGKKLFVYVCAGRKIAPDTGANATKFFMLATKSWKLVAKLATRISNHTLPRNLVVVEEDKSAAKFLVKFVSKTQRVHDFERKSIVTRRHFGFR